MLRLHKNRNVLCTLRDRETGSVLAPCRLSTNFLRQHIESDQSFYQKQWHKKSTKTITYDSGYMHFDNHTTIYSVYGPKCRPTLALQLKNKKAKEKVVDLITYTLPVFRDQEQCKCTFKNCLCHPNYFIYITKDHWLCQCDLKTGIMMREMYIKSTNHNFQFGYCDWDVYAEQFTLTSHLDPDPSSGVVAYLAVFTVFPFEFKYLFEIKRDIFGRSCRNVNVSQQLLIAGMGYDRVHIYSFLDVLAEGTFTQDAQCMTENIGKYPHGLPINYNIHRAPHLLFDVQCFGQTVEFGGYPYHCIFAKAKKHSQFVITNLSNYNVPKRGFIESNVWKDEPNIVYFHPDFSNRIILRDLLHVRCYQVINRPKVVKLKETFKLSFPYIAKSPVPESSSYGRKLNRLTELSVPYEKSIMAIDFDNELDLFGILGVHPNDPLGNGFIKLFDSYTGREVKTINLACKLIETNFYKLSIDLDIIIIIEKNEKDMFHATVYGLCSP